MPLKSFERIPPSRVSPIDSSAAIMSLRNYIAASLFIAIAPLTLAQSATPAPDAKPLAFEVVTIKPSNALGWNLYPTADGYHGMGVSLRQLVKEAYGVYDDKRIIGGQDWIDKDKFDLEARFDPAIVPNAKNLTFRQRADMLRAILTDRFQIKTHFVTKDFPSYDLVVAKATPKFTETSPDQITQSVWGSACLRKAGGRGTELMVGCTVGELAGALSGPTGRTVIDKTSISGRYSFELRYTPDNTPADSPLAGGPSIFTAIQEQLGLKLVPSTAPLDVLIVDSVQKPSDN